MSRLSAFQKACPAALSLTHRVDPATPYKYYLCGKNCVLGVLFEDSVHLYFEWIAEDGRPVRYGPEVRYKFWPKYEVARLIQARVWEVEEQPQPVVPQCEPSDEPRQNMYVLDPIRLN